MKTELKKFAELLNSHEVRGKIVKDVSFIDLFLGILISMYFTSDDRQLIFYKTIVEKMSVYNKIETLREIVRGKKYKSVEVVNRLERIRQLRNAVAHTHFLSTYEKIFRNKEIVNLLSDYPESYKKEIKAIKRQLRRLGDTKEFTHLNTKSA